MWTNIESVEYWTNRKSVRIVYYKIHAFKMEAKWWTSKMKYNQQKCLSTNSPTSSATQPTQNKTKPKPKPKTDVVSIQLFDASKVKHLFANFAWGQKNMRCDIFPITQQFNRISVCLREGDERRDIDKWKIKQGNESVFILKGFICLADCSQPTRF